MRRALIIACTQRKNSAENDLPAIERYDGPTFLVLRKYLREHPGDQIDIFVLSAKFGLISSSRPIPNYDLRLTKSTAQELLPRVVRKAREIFMGEKWNSVGVCAGKDYRAILDSVTALLVDSQIDMIGGGQGQRLTALRDWLRTTF